MADITYHCAADACNCKVTNVEPNVKTASGIFCCQACADGEGCSHAGCDCATKDKS